MLRFAHWVQPVAVVAAAVIIGACSSGSAGLTTGALLPGSKPAQDDPTQRAVLVSATSARAAKCGYNFDPVRLRASYLAYESAQGAAPELLGRLEKSYDFTRASVIQKMGPADAYCTDEKTAEIKRELTRHMAGDFAAPPKRAPPPSASWWGNPSGTPLEREKIFDPLARK